MTDSIIYCLTLPRKLASASLGCTTAHNWKENFLNKKHNLFSVSPSEYFITINPRLDFRTKRLNPALLLAKNTFRFVNTTKITSLTTLNLKNVFRLRVRPNWNYFDGDIFFSLFAPDTKHGRTFTTYSYSRGGYACTYIRKKAIQNLPDATIYIKYSYLFFHPIFTLSGELVCVCHK